MKKIFLKNPWIFIILPAHILLLIYLKFTAWPEMLLWPYLMIKGWLPYADIAIAHTPLLIFNLAIFYKIFGVGIIQLKIFTWILVLFTDGAVYFVVKKLWGQKTAVLSLISCAILLTFYDGNGLWFDLLMSLSAFISFFFARKKRWLWAGIFWALAFISKQTAVWFLLPLFLEAYRSGKLQIRNLKKVFWGGLVLGTLFTLLVFIFGIFKDFWFWAVNFGIFILPKSQGQVQLPDIKNLIIAAFPFAVLLPFWLNKKVRDINLTVWAIAGALGAYPRFEFFHFQPAVPFLAAIYGLTLINTSKVTGLLKVFFILFFIGGAYLIAGYVLRNWGEGTRFYESDVVDVVSYVKSNSKPGDKIFVMNWWDSIYALTDTLPATKPWVPQLSWYQELPGIQEKEVEDLKNNKPELIILNPYTEIGLSAYKPSKVYEFVNSNYNIKEKFDGIEILIPKK